MTTEHGGFRLRATRSAIGSSWSASCSRIATGALCTADAAPGGAPDRGPRSAVIGCLVAGAALKPVEAMRIEAEAISASEPERRLPLPAARDEIRRLGETLNEMLDRLGPALERERTFVAEASHELRTPLALPGRARAGDATARSPAELERALRSAADETDRLVRLAEDLLLVARADRGRLVALQSSRVCRGASRRCRPPVRGASERRREIVVDVDPGLALDVDALRRLTQALGNMVDNALRYGSGSVLLRASEGNGAVELHVVDDGEGFPPEFVEHAFERFTRADAARGGGGHGARAGNRGCDRPRARGVGAHRERRRERRRRVVVPPDEEVECGGCSCPRSPRRRLMSPRRRRGSRRSSASPPAWRARRLPRSGSPSLISRANSRKGRSGSVGGIA